MMTDDSPSFPIMNTATSNSPVIPGSRILIVILGPTASGKTSLAIDIAKDLNTEIISADSRQFFREMNIGTAKPTDEQLQQVKHYFINSLSIQDEYNAGIFERDALKILENFFNPGPKGGNTKDSGVGFGSLQGGGRTSAVMVGGSGLYIKAVCNGFDEIPEVNKELRSRLETTYMENGIEALQTLLKKHDEEYFMKVDIKNPHRLIRAIEVCMVTGKKYSELRRMDIAPDTLRSRQRQFTTIKIGLELEREELYSRINARVDEMMRNGLLEEVKSLLPYKHLNALQTVGYKELFEFIDRKTGMPDREAGLQTAIELIKQNTRNFAKRQMTWFRKDKEIKWFACKASIGEPAGQQEIIKYIYSQIK